MERQQGSDVADMPCSTPSTPSSSVSQSQSSASRLVLLLRTLSGTNLKTKKANDSNQQSQGVVESFILVCKGEKYEFFDDNDDGMQT